MPVDDACRVRTPSIQTLACAAIERSSDGSVDASGASASSVVASSARKAARIAPPSGTSGITGTWNDDPPPIDGAGQTPRSLGFAIASLSGGVIGKLRLTFFGGIGLVNHLA